MYYLPFEVKLDVLKFLNFEQLFSLQQTSSYFLALIDENEGKLAKEEFYSISIVNFNF